ncbi:hypothetical protein EPIR_3686 [Erwinia piriflorinigrans CFBP 5888]|uniref:Uncharacterized protein n=1 Tax=Erwinia piriflorinigrans CFBP 5888 TaxID=1161919 RepID=V5ZDE5_9GAMM|nr:hypothetical protein EPIR_3686 [Erwinia piriflorinigrans CFBP 5888]
MAALKRYFLVLITAKALNKSELAAIQATLWLIIDRSARFLAIQAAYPLTGRNETILSVLINGLRK